MVGYFLIKPKEHEILLFSKITDFCLFLTTKFIPCDFHYRCMRLGYMIQQINIILHLSSPLVYKYSILDVINFKAF